MSDGYLFLEESSSIDTRDTSATPPRLERFLRRTAVFLAIILAAELIWFLGVTPCLPFSRIDVMSIDGLSREKVLSVAGLSSRSSFVSLRAVSARTALEALPQVESARVVKRFPDRLSIELTGRKPVALALAEVGGRTVPVAFDRFGVVVDVGSDTSSSLFESSGLPIISGLVFERPTPGTRLPAFLDGFLSDLARLKSASPALLDALSEIRVQKRAYDGYELILYPSHRAVRVKIGAELNEDVLRYMMLVLDVLASKGIEADEIDFRTGTAAYRAKEASSG